MKIIETEVYGFKAALRGMRNPKNSWHLSDSISHTGTRSNNYKVQHENFIIGEKDMRLCQTLIKAGAEHMKFMRQIQVWADIDMTRFFWSEMDTYKFNSKNSCSTMHKLLNPKNEITLDLFDYYEEDEDVVKVIVQRLNEIREEFLNTKDFKLQSKLKRRAKSILMEGFLQLRTVNTNYAELRNIVFQRKHHQLKEDWQDTFCQWVTTLPYAKELIFCEMEDEYERLKEEA